MPVERFSSFDHMEGGTSRVLGASVALNRMLELLSFTPADCPPLYEPGTYRFRSIEEANEEREAATAERMRSLRAVREG